MSDQISETDFPDSGRIGGGVEIPQTRSERTNSGNGTESAVELNQSESCDSPAQSPSLTDRGLLIMAIQPQLQPEHIEENPGLGIVLGYFQKKYGPAFFPMPLRKKDADVNAVPSQGQNNQI